jgi:hypothetical protein
MSGYYHSVHSVETVEGWGVVTVRKFLSSMRYTFLLTTLKLENSKRMVSTV